MTLKLTDRDKKLLYILAVLILTVGLGYYVIVPLSDKCDETQVELEQQESEWAERQQKVALLPLYESNNKEYRDIITEKQKEFYPSMKSTDVDRILTNMALENNLEVNSMNISMPQDNEYTRLAAYQDTSEDNEMVYPGTMKATVSLTLTGSRTDLENMLDAVMAQEPKMQVLTYNWQEIVTNYDRTLQTAEATEASSDEAETEQEAAEEEAAEEQDPVEETEPESERVVVSYSDYKLGITLSLYMYQELDDFINNYYDTAQAADAQTDGSAADDQSADALLQ